MKWIKAKGFESRRTEFIAKYGGFVFRVTSMERIAGQFVRSPFYHAYIDSDYLGFAASIDAAKLICVLTALEYVK